MVPREKHLCSLPLTSINTNSLHFPKSQSQKQKKDRKKKEKKQTNKGKKLKTTKKGETKSQSQSASGVVSEAHHLVLSFPCGPVCLSPSLLLCLSLSTFLFFSGVCVPSVSHPFSPFKILVPSVFVPLSPAVVSLDSR